MIGIARKIARRALNSIDRGDHIRKMRNYYFRDYWLRDIENIVHVGANAGQEATRYADHGLGVLFIEPIPEVFAELEKNIAPYPKQKACRALVADVTGKTFTLNIASNAGQSSSIFDLAEHKEIWPDIGYIGSINIVSWTLDDILASDDRRYDCLVMDTQGAELMVLKGSVLSLKHFKYIWTEAADFEAYKGCATADDLINFLRPHGFREARRQVFARKPDGPGEFFDMLFQRV
jgi:FkbM family methyltransferase